MKSFLRRISLSSKGLRREFFVALGLVSTAFLVFIGYLFPGVSSVFIVRANLGVIVALAFFIITLGFITVHQMVEPIIRISREAKKIAAGDYNRRITLDKENEIGELSQALNRMSQRIKENMEELNAAQEKTEVINADINKRILGLTSLLQISNLISKNAHLDDILNTGMDTCLSSGTMSFCCLLLRVAHSDVYRVHSLHGAKKNSAELKHLKDYTVKLGQGVLGKALLQSEVMMFDKRSSRVADIDELQQTFLIRNAIIAPIFARRNAYGLLVVGNNTDNFTCSYEDRELFDLLAKQISIAMENTELAATVERLETIDSLTGLYNEVFVRQRLDEEIKRAIGFQRPCAFVLLEIDRFAEYYKAFGHIAAEQILQRIAVILKENIGDADKAARFSDHTFALILPEKNKKRAIHTAETVREKIVSAFAQKEAEKKITCTGAVSENPLDGATGNALIKKALECLASAEKEGGNRICL